MGPLLRTPRLWPEAARAAFASTPRRWWSRFPFLPIPDRAYLRWRIATAYGTADVRPDGDDLVAYLGWRRRQRRMGRGAA
ncbi:MAG: hypothetical protein KJP12_03310 [Acidimicrobiia bacterium]|nr:hypothetical protein [Acidimicrobiia bacterium]MBT8214228.1 hypothetical protein [Acidimicrobiia bacterium]NNK92440.1 hypothetical protein [Acidimicrobiia bacterium]